MKYFLLIAASLILTACGSDKKSSKDESIREIRPVNKTASNQPEYLFYSPIEGKIEMGGECRSSRRFAHKEINRIQLLLKKEGIYSKCTLQVIAEDGKKTDVLYISQFEANYPKSQVQSIWGGSDNSSPVSKTTVTYDEYRSILSRSHQELAIKELPAGIQYFRYEYLNGLISEEFADFNGDNVFDIKAVYQRDSSGNVTGIVTADLKSQSLIDTFSLVTSKDGRTLTAEIRGASNQLIRREITIRDKRDNHLRTETDDNGDGTINSIISRVFDSQDNKTEETIFIAPTLNKESERTVFTYNKFGDIETSQFYKNGELERFSPPSKRNHRGQAELITDKNAKGAITSQIYHKHDEWGSLTEVSIRHSPQEEFKTLFKIDYVY